MQVSKDIHLEKFLEAMIEQYMYDLGERAEECPVLQDMLECLNAMKASNNAEIRIEMGIVGNLKKCPCQRKFDQG